MKSNSTEDLTIRGIPRKPLALFHLIPIVVLVSAQTRSTPYISVPSTSSAQVFKAISKSSAHTLSAALSSRPPDMHWVVLPIHATFVSPVSAIKDTPSDAQSDDRVQESKSKAISDTYLH